MKENKTKLLKLFKENDYKNLEYSAKKKPKPKLKLN